MISRKNDMPQDVREQMRGGEGSACLTKLFPTLPEHMRLFSIITLEPGSSIGYHVHENETELFYFIEGVAECRDDEETVTLTAGDALATFSGHGHSVKSVGDTALRIVAAIIKD